MNMGEARTIAVLFLIASLFISWAEFIASGLGATVTMGLTPREVVVQGVGIIDAKETHTYSEYIATVETNPEAIKKINHEYYIIYVVGKYAPKLFLGLIISIALIAYAGITHNKYASLIGGVLSLSLAVYFVILIHSALQGLGYKYSILDLFTGVLVKQTTIFGTTSDSFRISWGWYAAVIGSLFALYGGKKRY